VKLVPCSFFIDKLIPLVGTRRVPQSLQKSERREARGERREEGGGKRLWIELPASIHFGALACQQLGSTVLSSRDDAAKYKDFQDFILQEVCEHSNATVHVPGRGFLVWLVL
jgi:hypothetical protein